MTENRNLFYYANQILHVENGIVSQSDFALGSFDSEYAEDETEEDDQNTYHSFDMFDQLCQQTKREDQEVSARQS